MKDTKRAAPVLQHQDGQVETGTGQATTSTTEHTITGPLGQVVHIADFLSRGAQNILSVKEANAID